jgi:hypothetical protein
LPTRCDLCDRSSMLRLTTVEEDIVASFTLVPTAW